MSESAPLTLGEAEAVTLGMVFVGAASVLREAGIETPELDARLLLCHAAGLTHEAYVARAREALAPEAAARLEAALRRRACAASRCRASPARASSTAGASWSIASALDPRPDTETLIEAALDLIEPDGGRQRPLVCSISARGPDASCSPFSPSCRRRAASAPISQLRRSASPRPTRVASA